MLRFILAALVAVAALSALDAPEASAGLFRSRACRQASGQWYAGKFFAEAKPVRRCVKAAVVVPAKVARVSVVGTARVVQGAAKGTAAVVRGTARVAAGVVTAPARAVQRARCANGRCPIH